MCLALASPPASATVLETASAMALVHAKALDLVKSRPPGSAMPTGQPSQAACSHVATGLATQAAPSAEALGSPALRQRRLRGR